MAKTARAPAWLARARIADGPVFMRFLYRARRSGLEILYDNWHLTAVETIARDCSYELRRINAGHAVGCFGQDDDDDVIVLAIGIIVVIYAFACRRL